MYTGENLNLNYNVIRDEQKKIRTSHNEKHNSEKQPNKEEPSTGDIVIVPSMDNKHKARNPYLVTNTTKDKITVQKIIHPFTDNSTKLRSKSYTTDKQRVNIIKKHIFKPMPTSKPKTVQKNTWNPIRIDEYTGKNEDNSVETIPVSTTDDIQRDNNESDTSEPDSLPSHQDPQPLDETPNEPHQHEDQYTILQEWLQLQQQTASNQLREGRNAISTFERPPRPPPASPVPDNQPKTSTPIKQVSKREQQKERAKRNIAKIYNVKIAQTDGCDSQPSSDTSPDSSPLQPEPTKYRKKSSTSYDFCDEEEFLHDTCLEWDEFNNTDELDNIDNSQIDLNEAFCISYLDLTASPTKPLDPNRVYKFHNLLNKLPPDIDLSSVPHKKRQQTKKIKPLFTKCLRNRPDKS